MDIIKRKEAEKQGLKRYFTGKPCPQKHIVERYVSNRQCTQCRVSKEDAVKLTQYRRTLPEGRYSSYKSNAKKRGLYFTLTLEYFKSHWKEPCAYCGEPIETIGLDRMDNDKGYTPDNVCSCCWDCNNMKNNYNKDEWLVKIKKIARLIFLIENSS